VAQEFTVLAFRSVKTSKPVLFGFSGDPLDVNLVQSWARSGGNFTGMSYLAIELVGKRIELLKEWLPQTRRIAVLARPPCLLRRRTQNSPSSRAKTIERGVAKSL
jgi:putative tryptophan/tyrosine transport system substrate-binding protein